MIDRDKLYTTRDGRSVRIYAMDGDKDSPIHGAVLDEYGWVPYSWKKNGKFYSSKKNNMDLIELKQRYIQNLWINIYPHTMFSAHSTRASADIFKKQADRFACVPITIEFVEGEGL